MTLIYIGLAGALGAMARYWASGLQGRRAFPWGTMAVNLLGSFLLGLLTGLVMKGLASPTAKAVLGTGFLGAFTTFSTFQVDTLRLHRGGRTTLAWLYLIASTGAGLLAAWGGLALGVSR